MRLRSDEGSAIVAVTAIGFVVTILLATIALRSQSSLGGAGNDRGEQLAIQAADDGLINAVFKSSAGELDPADDVTDPESGGRTREWAKGIADAMTASDTYTSPGAEWVRFRLAHGGDCTEPDPCTMYGVGYVPSKANPRHVRVIEATYRDLSSWVPLDLNHGMATDGDLYLSGGTSFRAPADYDPPCTRPEGDTGGCVHVNGRRTPNPRLGDVQVEGGDPAPEQGYVTSSGTCYRSTNPRCTANQPFINVPDIRPRNYWYQSQYELCPDGTMRKGPSYATTGATDLTGVPDAQTGTPCPSPPLDGSVLATAAQTAATTNHPRGWRGIRVGTSDYDKKNTAINWEYKGGNGTRYDGVYYVLYGNADISAPTANPPVKLTVIAESEEPAGWVTREDHGDCEAARQTVPINSHGTAVSRQAWGHFGGDIRTFGSHLAPYTGVGPLFLVAGRDINFGKIDNSAGQPGIVMAHEQFKSTSLTMNFTGAVMSDDVCNSNSTSANAMVGSNEISGAGNMPNDWILTCCPDGFQFPQGSGEGGTTAAPVHILRWLEL